jgi:DUF971 family protein
MSDQDTVPSGIKLHTRSRELELNYSGGDSYRLSCEYLRVYSPSAEVRGHGPGQETLQTGKLKVAISEIKPVGNYALQLVFDDGHDTGIYAWDYLYHLCVDRERLWQDYLDRLDQAGANRDPDVQVLHFDP